MNADDSVRQFLPKASLEALIAALRDQGYTVLGPRERDGVIALREVHAAADLAHGMHDEQAPGHYRLTADDDQLYFNYVLGADGPKRYLFPAQQRVVQLHVEGQRFVMDAASPAPPKLAFLGVRACELAAIAVQDRVFGADDPRTFRCEAELSYCETRRNAFFVAVNCTRPGGTCFCVSMGTGPKAERGYDLALTELRAGFVVEIGSERGREVAAQLPLRLPTEAELELADIKLAQARHSMGRTLQTDGLRTTLARNIEHPRWDQVAKRCLSCGNCTMVCPTCFCSTVVDSSALDGGSVTRTRLWESCFTHQFSYAHPGPVRHSIRGRYRQWLRHKLSTWWDQFGSSGCVGCGRCITWCPVGIDITEEACAIAATPSQSNSPFAEAWEGEGEAEAAGEVPR